MEYQQQEISLSTFAKMKRITPKTLKRWIGLFQRYGPAGLQAVRNNAHYSQTFKLRVVQAYLAGEGTLETLSIKFGLRGTRQLEEWISKYNGDKLTASPSRKQVPIMSRKTTFEERIDIVKDYIESGTSYEEIAEKYGISYQQIYQWVRKYQEHGIDSLQDRRGKRKALENMTEIDRLRAELKMEQAKVKHLELENRVLKKLKEIERRRY